MLPSRRSALIAAVALALAGCHTVRMETGRPETQRRYETTVHFYVWGLAGEGRIDLDAACPEGVAAIHSGVTASGWVAEVLTLGLWSPRTVVVDCSPPEARR